MEFISTITVTKHTSAGCRGNVLKTRSKWKKFQINLPICYNSLFSPKTISFALLQSMHKNHRTVNIVGSDIIIACTESMHHVYWMMNTWREVGHPDTMTQKRKFIWLSMHHEQVNLYWWMECVVPDKNYFHCFWQLSIQ